MFFVLFFVACSFVFFCLLCFFFCFFLCVCVLFFNFLLFLEYAWANECVDLFIWHSNGYAHSLLASDFSFVYVFVSFCFVFYLQAY